MNSIELLSILFTDELCANLIILNSESVILPSMLMFGGYDINSLVAVSCVARFCSALLNYLLGIVIYNIFIKFSTHEILQQRYSLLQSIFNKYGMLILLGCAVPVLGSAITLIAGIIRYKIIRTALFFASFGSIYYIY